ncbi:hypothetical protein Y1Q_0010542 [Alligator mississippiensis]|uniref:Uncharacterized protein n=1 Tax=Alligator mississippiensis TaxID=8496 RepID=A0A151NE40_ALLMI|nr:hypothetical protein Y1Q_0010542 [Alligator mississippiensis]
MTLKLGNGSEWMAQRSPLPYLISQTTVIQVIRVELVSPSAMSEPEITYLTVKFDPSKSQEHENKAVREKEMTTYSELKFQIQAEQQTGRFQQADGRDAECSPSPSRRNKDPSAPSRQWQHATVILGILCLVLLIATGVLGYKGKFRVKDPQQI